MQNLLSNIAWAYVLPQKLIAKAKKEESLSLNCLKKLKTGRKLGAEENVLLHPNEWQTHKFPADKRDVRIV